MILKLILKSGHKCVDNIIIGKKCVFSSLIVVEEKPEEAKRY